MGKGVVKAGIAGAIIGASAAAAAIALSDEKRRKKVQKEGQRILNMADLRASKAIDKVTEKVEKLDPEVKDLKKTAQPKK